MVRFEDDFKLLSEEVASLMSHYETLKNFTGEDPDPLSSNHKLAPYIYPPEQEIDIYVLISNPLVRESKDGKFVQINRTPILIPEVD